jgi:hypothetical protein
MTTPSKALKKKRVEFTVEQMHEIICYEEVNPKVTQIQLKATFDKIFDTNIGKATICDILKLK